jgi:hypothetical protein
MAILWLNLAITILVGTYISLPLIANGTLQTFHAVQVDQSTAAKANASQIGPENKAPHLEMYAIGVLALGLFAICFACFLLGRTAFVEIELAARFVGVADALCIAGEDFDQLEKAVNLLVPGTKYLSVPDIFSIKDLGSVVDVMKELRPK